MTIASRLRLLLAGTLAAVGALAACAAPPVERVKLPPGFAISVFAEDVKDARSMALGDKGWLFVSTRRAGNVYAIRHDGVKALETVTIATGLNMPNGVALKDGALYVALADSGLASDIKAGENAGARLAHDHVVRWFRAGPSPDDLGRGDARVHPGARGARPQGRLHVLRLPDRRRAARADA